jgi:uncharacterized protein (TIGR03083 family)
MTDLILHLGVVHRRVARIIGERKQQPLGGGDRSWLGLAGEWKGWLPPGRAPHWAAVPAGLLGWFHAGAADLQERFRAADPGEPVWTWSADHTVGFWQRMQAIEAAVHRWDAENAVGAAQLLDAALATDAIGQTFRDHGPHAACRSEVGARTGRAILVPAHRRARNVGSAVRQRRCPARYA